MPSIVLEIDSIWGEYLSNDLSLVQHLSDRHIANLPNVRYGSGDERLSIFFSRFAQDRASLLEGVLTILSSRLIVNTGLSVGFIISKSKTCPALMTFRGCM